jgi:general L-amino acid transport system permease protein
MSTGSADNRRQPTLIQLPTLSLSDPHLRSWLYQGLALLGVAFVFWSLAGNAQRNIELRGIATGFGFLWREAGLPIAETPIIYQPSDTYARALLVGVLNTLKVALIGIVLATLLGTLIGIAQLSTNWLLSRLAAAYVEVLRDLPLLLQLLFWYTLLQALPAARGALELAPGVFLSNRGLKLPTVILDSDHWLVAMAALLGALLTIGFAFFARRARHSDGKPRAVWPVAVALIVLIPIATWWTTGAPFNVQFPELRGFNFRGGILLSPEFVALLIGLVTYTAAFIAEIVRGGVLSVGQGQWEAGRALGLRNGLVLRKIVLPQALRLIIPPLTSQYLNLTKNSSLAIAIGYQDIVSIANTTLNQTGQAIEGIAIIMAVYLTISLAISIFMNWYNARIALTER